MTSFQAATSAVTSQYKHMDFSKMEAALDIWNLMVSLCSPPEFGNHMLTGTP